MDTNPLVSLRFDAKPQKGTNPYAFWQEVIQAHINSHGGLDWLREGDSVLIKPACNSGYRHPMTTLPDAVHAMARILIDHGARVFVGDQGGVERVQLTSKKKRGSSYKQLEHSGIARAAWDAGAKVFPFDEEGFTAYFFEELSASVSPNSSWPRGAYFTKLLERVDHVINMPRLASHAIASYTCGLKNVIGYTRDDSRHEFHADGENFFKRFVELNLFPTLRNKHRLTLTCVDHILLKVGPDQGLKVSAGKPLGHSVGLSLASANIGAHDALAFSLIDYYDAHSKGFPDLVRKIVGRNFVNKVLTRLCWKDAATDLSPCPLGLPINEDPALSHWFALTLGGMPSGIQVKVSGNALQHPAYSGIKGSRNNIFAFEEA